MSRAAAARVRGLWYRRSTALIVLVPGGRRPARQRRRAAVLPRGRGVHRARHAAARRRLQPRRARLPRPGRPLATRSARGAAAPFAAALRCATTSPTRPSARRRWRTQTRGSYHPTAGPIKGSDVVGRVVERAGVCAHLPTLAGRCPSRPREGIVTRRSLALLGAKVGDTVPIELPELTADHETAARAPPTCSSGSSAPSTRCRVRDAVLGGAALLHRVLPDGAPERARRRRRRSPTPCSSARGRPRRPASPATPSTCRCCPTGCGWTTHRTLRHQVQRLQQVRGAYGTRQPYSSSRPRSTRPTTGRELVRIAAPLAVTQLVLLAWWTLYLVVGSATEERSPSWGWPSCAGSPSGQTGRFGLAEIVLLLLVAAPLGTVAGLPRRTRGRRRTSSRPGTQVVLTCRCCSLSSIALAGGVVTAALAARRVFRRPVGDLLRRVPPGAAARRGHGRSRASSSRWRSPASCSWSATAAAGRARSRCSRPAWSRWSAGCVAGRLLVGVARSGAVRGGAGARQGGPARRLVPASPADPAPRASPRCWPSPPACCWSASRRGRSPTATGSSAPSAEDGRRRRAAGAGARHAGAARRRCAPPTRTGATRWRPCSVTTTNQQDAGARGRRAAAPTASCAGARPTRSRRTVDPLDHRAPRATVDPARAAGPPRGRRHRHPARSRRRRSRLTARLDRGRHPDARCRSGRWSAGGTTYAAEVPAACAPRLPAGGAVARPPGHRPGYARPSRLTVASMSAAGPAGDVRPLATALRRGPTSWRAGAATTGGPAGDAARRAASSAWTWSRPAAPTPRSCAATRPSRCRRTPGSQAGRDPREPGAVPDR